MLDIAISILFVVVAIRIANAVRRELAIFEEFRKKKNLALFVLLFPVGPVVLLGMPYFAGWLPAVILAFACYLPALLESRQCIAAFSRSRTDRTKVALSASHEAFGISLLGLAYVSIHLLLFIAAGYVGGQAI